MAEVRDAFLCNYAAQDTSGLVSAMGAFVDTVYGAVIPITNIFYLVARLEHDASEADRDIPFAIQIARDADGALMVDASGTLQVQRDPTADPAAPLVGQMIVPIPVSFDQAGSHTLTLVLDGVPIWHTPISAVLLH
jgi:Family of unknown function (DUF6941)